MYVSSFSPSRRFDKGCVVKASGLAAGKGVHIAKTIGEAFTAVDEIMVNQKYGKAGCAVVIEELLEGFEVSVSLILARDYR